jgi:hypothetical protein
MRGDALHRPYRDIYGKGAVVVEWLNTSKPTAPSIEYVIKLLGFEMAPGK